MSICFGFQIQGFQLHLSDFSFQMLPVFIQIAMQMGIASVTLPMDIVLIKSENRIVSCAVKMPSMHLGYWLKIPAADADKSILNHLRIPIPNPSIKMLHGKLFQRCKVLVDVRFDVFRFHGKKHEEKAIRQ